MHAEPRISSGQTSQQLAGHTVEIVEARDEWLRARSADMYEGWIHRGHLIPAVDVDPANRRVSLGCTVRLADGALRALPLLAYLTADEVVVSGEAVNSAELGRGFPHTANAITSSALNFFQGTSYQWGGVTPWGADCSGIVQTVFALHGLQLPRDAWQQAGVSSAAQPQLLAAGAGDLLFFSDRDDGHITHVGIALGERRMVHLALGRGGYAVEQLDDSADGYVSKLLERAVSVRPFSTITAAQ